MENSKVPLAPMSDFRVFASAPSQNLLTLPAGESHHLVTVNRARTGDTVIAFDGHGTEWTCELTDARKRIPGAVQAGPQARRRGTMTVRLLPLLL